MTRENGVLHGGNVARSVLIEEVERLRAENATLQEREQEAISYIREKVNQLLEVMGTLPLRAEELDDRTLIDLDPVGIISDSFAQVLEHLQSTNEDLILARDEIRAIFDSAGAAILVVDREMRIKAFNVRSRELFFPGETTIAGRAVRPILCPDDQDCVFDTVIATRQAAEQNAFVHAGRYFHVVGTPICQRGEEVTQVVLVYTDVTARRQAEQLLREAEERLQMIFGSVQAGILLIDAETHRIVDANDMALELIGGSRERLLNAVCHQYVCPAEEGQCPLTDLGQSLDNSERLLLTRSGGSVPILKTATVVMLEGRRHLLESFIDISDRKQTERALIESEERYRSLYSTMREGVALHQLVYDEEGRPCDYRLLDVNPAFETIFGVPRGEVVGRRASEIFALSPPYASPPYLDVYARVARNGSPVTFEAVFAPLQKVFSVSAVSPSAGHFAAIFEDITERKRAEDQIHRLAYFDSLTALPNRTLLKDRLDQSIAQASRSRQMVAVMFIDIDRFKGINDTLGHHLGDQLLKALGTRLQECVRHSDTVARLGGDEFVIMLTGVVSEQAVVRIAQNALDALAKPVSLDGQEVFSTGSIGIALYPMDGSDVDTLLKNADIAMYQAKELGRNTYQFYSADMNAHNLEQLFLGNDLRRALEREEFSLVYQPQVNLTTGCLIGAEALLRWNHAELGLISPVQFIPLAEESGLIVPLGQWVLRSACAQARAWQKAGLAAVRVAVNISACQFRQTDLVGMVERILEETGLDAQWLELELTEGVLMENADATKRILRELKQMGISLAIDDFGTGYSSLNYLKHFPIDRLKIDRSFVNDINVNPDDAAIAEAIIALAHSLRLQVMAEGVESREQIEFLHVRFCEEMQGFYFGQPLAAEHFAGLLGSGLSIGEFTFEAGPVAGGVG
jgi:diguanylate cyclase (GGDEF)-like protein/PAS domain S-box-containing protein